MDTAQCSTFSTRSNAKRAAEKMITDGTAPAIDYGIKPREDGRFEIKWKTNPAPATEAELTAFTETATGDGEPMPPAAPTIGASEEELTQSAAQATPGASGSKSSGAGMTRPSPTRPLQRRRRGPQRLRKALRQVPSRIPSSRGSRRRG